MVKTGRLTKGNEMDVARIYVVLIMVEAEVVECGVIDHTQ